MTQILSLDQAWEFRRLADHGAPAGGWSRVDLPHNPFSADLDGRTHWFGWCEYRRSLALPPGAPAGRIALAVGAAMHSAVVLIDGQECGRHTGGFLPFEVDLTAALRDGGPHLLTLRLDNRDNPDVPPGKPYADLDFCWYGGLYRGADLRCSPALHITDAVAAGEVAGGGVFVRTLAASAASAKVSVRTHVRNAGTDPQTFACEVELRHGAKTVAQGRTASRVLAPGATATLELELSIDRPSLWQIESPALQVAHVTVRKADGQIADTGAARFGLRWIAFSRSGGFTLNGRRRRLRGTNRHQEYPFAGYAVPAAAQRRDAVRIKEAGFDYVRLAHYPQSPDFLDACDELGLLVMNCIPGWQFMGGDAFRAACERNTRDLIRRDRNHPCVVLWELSLNETAMDAAFMARLHGAGHEEFPGDQLFTCGWQDGYDVYIHSRQHGEIHRWQNGDKALVIAEYGDWEFFASNHGFDQKTGAGIYAGWSHGRQRRQNGERGLRQQVDNHLIALNDTLSSPAVLDGQWSMFDYARGYDRDRAACGIMDIFRLPKFSYYFYRSQRDAGASGEGWSHGPLVFIASHWTPASALRILIFSNCSEVELKLNGRSLGRQPAAKAWLTQYLPHPPFVFDLPAFVPGVLEATGILDGQPVAAHRVATPGAPARLTLAIDAAGVVPMTGEPDLLLAHASLVDAAGTLCVEDTSSVVFTVEGGACLLGPTTVEAEAGIASVVVRVGRADQAFKLRATFDQGGTVFAAECTWARPADAAAERSKTPRELAAGVAK